MSRYAEALAPVLKVLVVVVIIAAWVEANATRTQQESVPPPASSFSKAPPTPGFDPFRRTETQASTTDSCSPTVDRRNVTRVAPARPAVIKT